MRTMPWKILLILAIAGIAFTAHAQSETVYFVVADPSGFRDDSYILPLTAQEDIEQARRLIEEGPDSVEKSAVVARIAKGSNGVNRDWLAPGKPAWSWHVTEFQEFGGPYFAAVPSKSPSHVEADVDGWIEEYDGLVAFSSFTIIEELEKYLWARVRKEPNGIRFEWRDLGEGFGYTLEHKLVGEPNWRVVPGEDWPIEETSWFVKEPLIGKPVFRVRAEPIFEGATE